MPQVATSPKIPRRIATTRQRPVCDRARQRTKPHGITHMRMSHLALAALLLSPTGAYADCSSEVNDAFAKLRATPAFSMQTRITNAQGTLTMSNDYVMPDRMHQQVTLSSSNAGAMEMILIGDKAWSNQGSNGWAPLPPSFASKIAVQMKETVAEPPKDTSQFECLGDVAFEGKTYKAYRAKREAPPQKGEAGPTKAAAAALPNVQTVYVDKATGLPARNIVTPESDPEKRLFDGTFAVRDGLKIEAPQS
jgi:hypothetical protein